MVGLSDLNGGLQHTVGVLGELDERGFTLPDLLEDDEGLIDSLGHGLVDVGGGLEVMGGSVSVLLDGNEVSSVVGELLLGLGKITVGSGLLGGTSVEGFSGFLDGGDGCTT